MIGVAAGASAVGLKPFTHTFGPFAARRVIDQVYISAAYAKLNVRMIGSGNCSASPLPTMAAPICRLRTRPRIFLAGHSA